MLVMAPRPDGAGHDATLFVREYHHAGSEGYFTDHQFGAIWVGNVPTPAETAEVLALALPAADRAAPRSWPPGATTSAPCSPATTRSWIRLLPGRVGRPAGHGHRRAAPDQGRLGDRPAPARLRRDRPRVRRRGPRDPARARPSGARRALARGHVLAPGPARGQRGRVHLDHRVGRERARPCTGGATTAGSRSGDLLLADMGVETDEIHTADVTRTFPLTGQWSPDAAQGLLRRPRGAGGRHRRGAGWATTSWPRNRASDAGPGRAPALVGHPRRPRGRLLQRRPRATGCGPSPPLDAARRLAQPGPRRARLRHARATRSTCTARWAPTTCSPSSRGCTSRSTTCRFPPEFRGIGVRIEDDIQVTATGPVNLSRALPRDPDEITAWMREVQATAAEL